MVTVVSWPIDIIKKIFGLGKNEVTDKYPNSFYTTRVSKDA